jgi:hypothetical protein
MVGFGMGEGLPREGLCHRKDHRWFLMRSSWFAVISHGKGPAVGGSPCKTPQSGPCTVPPHKAHFAGVVFLHLRPLASTLFKKKHTHTQQPILYG